MFPENPSSTIMFPHIPQILTTKHLTLHSQKLPSNGMRHVTIHICQIHQYHCNSQNLPLMVCLWVLPVRHSLQEVGSLLVIFREAVQNLYRTVAGRIDFLPRIQCTLNIALADMYLKLKMLSLKLLQCYTSSCHVYIDKAKGAKEGQRVDEGQQKRLIG